MFLRYLHGLLLLASFIEIHGIEYLSFPALLQEIQDGLSTCVGPCLLEEAWQLQQEVDGVDGPYSQCLDHLGNLLPASFSDAEQFLNFLTVFGDNGNCASLTSTLNCLVILLTQRCGAGVEAPLLGVADKLKDFLSCNPSTTDGSSCTLDQLSPGTLVDQDVDGVDGPFDLGTELVFTCSTGFRFGQESHQDEASVTIRCTRTGWDVAQMPNCQPVHCGAIPEVANGYVSSSTTTMSDAEPLFPALVLTYACDAGFTISTGTQDVTCQTDGTWSQTPTCTAAVCAALDTVTDSPIEAVTVRGSGTDHGTVIQYSCTSTSAVLQGPYSDDPFRVCLDGDWDPGDNLPTCVPRSCLLPSIYNAEPFSGAKLDIGASVSVTCSPGFELDGPSTVTCSDTTVTLSQVPTCVDIKECTLETDGCTGDCVEAPGTFLCTCPDGQTLDTDGKTCIDIDPCAPTDLCRDGTCVPSDVTYTCTCTLDKVLFTADGDQGYNIPTSEVGLDTINNTRRLNHICVSRQCVFDNTLDNGYLLSYKPIYHDGDTVSFRCKVGFILQGAVTLTCDNTGEWSAVFPTCQAATCTIPSENDVNVQPQYSMNGDSLSPGDTVEYGATVNITCTDGRPPNEPYVTTRTCLYNFNNGVYALGQDQPFDCQVARIVCDPPYTDVDVGAGELQSAAEVLQGEENVYGVLYNIVCHDGVPLQNSQPVTCGEDGKWELGTAYCEAPVVQCDDPGGPPDASQIINDEYILGSTVTFTCPQPGFITEPPYLSTVTCAEGPSGTTWEANGVLTDLRCADNDPPKVICPGDQTVALYEQIDLDLTTVATDNYGGVVNVMASFEPNFVYGARITQTTAVTLVATTPNNPIPPGDSAECSYTITVPDIEDTIAPIVTCPDSFEYYTTAETPTNVDINEALGQAERLSPTATDDVSAELSVTSTPTSFMASSENINDVIIVTANAIDGAGNTGMCKYAIVVRPCCVAWAIPTPANASKICEDITGSGGNVLECTITCHPGFYMHDSPADSTQVFTCNYATHTWNPTGRVFDCLEPRESKAKFTISFDYYSEATSDPSCIAEYLASLENAYDNFLTSNTVCPPTPNSDIGTINLSKPDPSENNITQGGPEVTWVGTIVFLLSRSHDDPQDVDLTACADTLQKEFELVSLQGDTCEPISPDGGSELLERSCFPWEATTPDQKCVPCPSGTYTDRDLTTGSCNECPIGEYSLTANVDSCTACGTGQVTRKHGTQQAEECIEQCQFYHGNGYDFPGVASTGHMPCSECPRGQTVSSTTPNQDCVDCDGTNCQIECAAGNYSTSANSAGFEPCAPCPIGFYNENPRRASCSPCSHDELTASTGSTSPNDCTGVATCDPSCENNGTCEIQSHITVCVCPAGTTGPTCSHFTACDSNPCWNGAVCTPTINSFSCACTGGYTGMTCGNSNFCSDNGGTLDCGTDGKCQEVAPAGKCICKPGYTGTNCEIAPTDPCTSAPCENGGACANMETIRRNCTCQPGFTGVNCQSNIDECISRPCLNGGVCADGDNGWSCSCTDYFSGTDCSTPTATCADPAASCAGGRCIPDLWEGGEKCVCPPGYSVGSNGCSDEIWCIDFTSVGKACVYQDPCVPNNPCQNGGSCSDASPPSDEYVCTCVTGYTGLNCQIIEDDSNLFNCPINNCQNSGTCKVKLDETTTCICAKGWTGPTCAEGLDECASDPCVEGTCVNGDNFYSCTCTPGYFGLQCQINIDECESTPCYHGGTCMDGVNEYTCECTEGWTGPNCNTLVTTCTSSSPCQNNAQCTDIFNDTYCLCPSRTSGPYCDTVPDVCATADPCVGGGACSVTGGQGVTCDCSQASVGRVGTFCENERDYCSEFQTSPCKWSRRCVSEANSHVCRGKNRFCLLDPVSYDMNSDASLYSCYDTYYQSLGTLVDTTFTNEQEFNALLTSIAQQSCGSIDTMIECMKETLGNTLDGCEDEEAELMDLIYIPTLAYFKELGNCDHDLLNSLPADDCRCLQGYTVDKTVFGTCNVTFMETVAQIQVGIDWMDELAGMTCEQMPVFHVICEKVDQIARNLTVSSRIKFQGLSPTSSSKVNVTFSASNLRQVLLESWLSRVKSLVSEGLVGTTPVSQNLHTVTQIPGQIRIQDVHPNFGPQAGGTRITITGFNLDKVLVTNLGILECIHKHGDNVVILSETPALTDSGLLGTFLNVTVFVTDEPTYTGQVFAYGPDPVITSVEPLTTIISGGTILTINGEHLDSVSQPIMYTTIELRSDPTRRFTYRTPCTVITPTVMHCVTPSINLQDLQPSRRRRDVTRQRRQAGVQTVNDMEEINVHVGFELDGVPTYRNLTAGGLDRYSQLTVYNDPTIDRFPSPDFTQQFVSTWPVSDRQMEIDGKDLNLALTENDITVKVGLAICEQVQLFSNKIICEPPIKRPEVGADDRTPNDQKIPIKVLFAGKVNDVGDLFYIQTVWEYEPTRYGIIGGLCGLIFLIAFITLIYCLWRRGCFRGGVPFYGNSYTHQSKGYDDHSHRNFGSYVPRAARGGAPSYYSESMGSGAGYNLFRGGTGRSFYH